MKRLETVRGKAASFVAALALAAVCAIGLASPAYAATIQIDDAEAIF